ncbi:hypothetical protein TrVE_jg5138 [Triparma verrucosa]|uniref:Uncharacterized protein n=1 Tax=Triparma verrucosa TaxID=1606542 RepID=A0A9W7B5S9_9STRA|nr:hypothetical protein TrVE_jg5138 [Triparma verrucosa]
MSSCSQSLCPVYGDDAGDDIEPEIVSYCDYNVDPDCECDCNIQSCSSWYQSCYDTVNDDQPPFPSGGQGCDLVYCDKLEISDEVMNIIELVGSVIGGLIGLCCMCGVVYFFYEARQSTDSARKKEKLREWKQNQGQFQAPLSHVPVQFTDSNFDTEQGHQFVAHNQVPASINYRVQVPMTGMPPGGQLLVSLPDGQQGYCQLPPNAQPGQFFDLPVQTLPPVAPQQMMAMAPVPMQQAEVMVSAPPMAEAVVYGSTVKK